MGREQFDGVAADAEGAADEAGVAALVLQRDEAAEQLALVDAFAALSGRRSWPCRSPTEPMP